MFGFLKTKNDFLRPVQAVYKIAQEQSRHQAFYKDLGVPDTMDGRFDMLLLHIYLIYERLGQDTQSVRDFNQALFDYAFSDMDQALREVGIGDMGIPKHMRRMMQGFNGRMHAYQEVRSDKKQFCDILKRNVYGTSDKDIDEKNLERLYDYVVEKRQVLSHQDEDEILNGTIFF